jgi:hypothetical protein
MLSARFSCQILMKLEFSQQIFEKYSNIKFHENPSIGSPVLPCIRTDTTKLTDAFRNFAKAPKMSCPYREMNQGSSVVHMVAYSLY